MPQNSPDEKAAAINSSSHRLAKFHNTGQRFYQRDLAQRNALMSRIRDKNMVMHLLEDVLSREEIGTGNIVYSRALPACL